MAEKSTLNQAVDTTYNKNPMNDTTGQQDSKEMDSAVTSPIQDLPSTSFVSSHELPQADTLEGDTLIDQDQTPSMKQTAAGAPELDRDIKCTKAATRGTKRHADISDDDEPDHKRVRWENVKSADDLPNYEDAVADNDKEPVFKPERLIWTAQSIAATANAPPKVARPTSNLIDKGVAGMFGL